MIERYDRGTGIKYPITPPNLGHSTQRWIFNVDQSLVALYTHLIPPSILPLEVMEGGNASSCPAVVEMVVDHRRSLLGHRKTNKRLGFPTGIHR